VLSWQPDDIVLRLLRHGGFSRQLQRDGCLDHDAAWRLGVSGWFDALIGNNDRHLSNAGVLLADTRPLALAPAYDRLPLAFRPAASGEVVERDYTLALPTPEYRDGWRAAATMAPDFWERVAQAGAISAGFRGVAARARQQLGRALQCIG
jgi:serine/threonine protein kinase HipA of HipAB toxin-antitoxin module